MSYVLHYKPFEMNVYRRSYLEFSYFRMDYCLKLKRNASRMITDLIFMLVILDIQSLNWAILKH